MRAIIVLASIPVIVLVAARTPPSPPIAARTVAVEGVREARKDDTSFNLRWSPTGDLPPATIERQVTLVEPMPPDNRPIHIATLTRQATVRKSTSARVARLDLCQRHRMHKVWQGRSWRCRR